MEGLKGRGYEGELESVGLALWNVIRAICSEGGCGHLWGLEKDEIDLIFMFRIAKVKTRYG